MSDATAPDGAQESHTRLNVLGAVGVVAAGLIIPGAGLVVALVLAFTLLRDHPKARAWIVVLGVAMTVLAFGMYASPWGSSSGVGPATIVQPVTNG